MCRRQRGEKISVKKSTRYIGIIQAIESNLSSQSSQTYNRACGQIRHSWRDVVDLRYVDRWPNCSFPDRKTGHIYPSNWNTKNYNYNLVKMYLIHYHAFNDEFEYLSIKYGAVQHN